MVENYIVFLYSAFSIGGIIGLFKSVDWLISTKYKTKDSCEKCRNNIYEIINNDRTLLVRLDAKMDLILKQTRKNDYD